MNQTNKRLMVGSAGITGVAMGKSYIFRKQALSPSKQLISAHGIQDEINRYDNAIEDAVRQLEGVDSPILKAHIDLLRDFALQDSVMNKITNDLQNAELALDNAIEEFLSIFESMEDGYMKERAADFRDIRDRVMRVLKGLAPIGGQLDTGSEPVILVAEDLVPSDTVTLTPETVAGFITKLGGATSHVAIIAKTLGLPALVGIGDSFHEIDEQDYILMDAEIGEIILNPDGDLLKSYTEKQSRQKETEKLCLECAHLPAVTKDGKRIMVCANVGSPAEVEQAMKYHADGIGLFRSEFLYMENTRFPTEEEQFAAYMQAAACGKEVIIRTLDIGGDKELPYYEFPKEENPFLGWRAIRISLELPDMFKTQLRALLRASAFGDIRIMYPMIVSVEELEKANRILSECKQELDAERTAYNPDIKTGVMIETPAAAICARQLAKHADFFSIGTNDLTQYTLAADRGNQKTAGIYNPWHPSVLWSVQHIIKAGHDAGIPVGMCGDFASSQEAIQLLLGMGLDEFSVPPRIIPVIKKMLREAQFEESSQLARNTIDGLML